MTDFEGTGRYTTKTPLLFRRNMLFGFAAAGFVGMAAACASQQKSGITLKNSGTALLIADRGEQRGERLKRVGQVLTNASQSNNELEYGVLSGSALIATFPAQNALMVSATLIALCENDGQIAAVLAQRMAFVKLPAGGAVVHNLSEALNLAPTTMALADITSQADIAAIRALARAGYDPRDGMIIWQRVGRTGGDGALPHAARLANMASELRTLGYQV